MKKTKTQVFYLLALTLLFCHCDHNNTAAERPIQAFCIDFNWGDGGPNRFAKPGLWADASPGEHVQWYKEMGVNVIQTFCVSCNGYAWYKNGVVPEQTGLKTDFLREMVRLGHKEGMQVMGYFCIGANTRWGLDHPDLSYGIPNAPHIPLTGRYLAYLDSAIRDAVKTTGMDGFMIDWVWQPSRKENEDRWIQSEKDLFKEIMNEDFPGEDELSEESYTTYSRLAIERCWNVIHTAAKESDPDCIIWLSCNDPTHPHVLNSDMFKEIDWLMNEKGDLETIESIQTMVGEQTSLLTCFANWNKMDAASVIPDAIERGIGLYGFTRPGENSLLPAIDTYLSQPAESFTGDGKNIAYLSRVFNGLPFDYVKH